MKKIKKILTSVPVKRALWIMLSAGFSYGVVYFGGLNEWYGVILTGICASATRELNGYLSN